MISHGPSQQTFQTTIPKTIHPWCMCIPYNQNPHSPLATYIPCFPTAGLYYNYMDESWRSRMGTTAIKQPNNLPPRRSTEDTNGLRGYEALNPEDFDDVFGGPPRSVLSRQFSVEGDFARSASFVFGDIFKKSDPGGRADHRMLPEFRIPESRTVGGRRMNEEEFYSDIFGNSRISRSRSKSQTNSKSKSNSSSILSSEELSPFRPAVVDDDDLSISSFALKLRPINVFSKWNTSKKMHEAHQMADGQPDSPCNSHSFESDYIHKFKGGYSGFSQRVSSPEITTFRANSYTSVKESIEDLQVNSPASMVSSLNQEQGDEASTIHEEEDDEVMSSYVIEINPSKNKGKIGESLDVDEAIAWAKQKCQTSNSEKEWNKREDDERNECPGVEERRDVDNGPKANLARDGSRESASLDKEKLWTTEEPLQEPEKDMELELLDEDIKLWSDGKERNIRLLLSTLHHILWPSSGWIMIPLSNLKDSTNVKKAYQKARLCLHPDKLQQRGATIPLKYVSEKAFPILQDAWAAFISQDVQSSLV